MKSKFTAAPWAVHPINAQVDALPSCTPVCQLLWPTDLRSEDETEANAHLIAAAPALYEALCDMVSDHKCVSEATLDFARQALAQARGEHK